MANRKIKTNKSTTRVTEPREKSNVTLSKNPLVRMRQIQKLQDDKIRNKFVTMQEQYEEDADVAKMMKLKNLESLDPERLNIVRSILKKQKQQKKLTPARNVMINDPFQQVLPAYGPPNRRGRPSSSMASSASSSSSSSRSGRQGRPPRFIGSDEEKYPDDEQKYPSNPSSRRSSFATQSDNPYDYSFLGPEHPFNIVGRGKRGFNTLKEGLYFPTDPTKPRNIQAADTRDRVIKELQAKYMLQNNLYKMKAEEGSRNAANQLYGLKTEQAVENKFKGGSTPYMVEDAANKKTKGYNKPDVEINEDNAIRNLKNTELSKRLFQQKIDKIQKDNPDEVNSALQSMFNELPTSKIMMEDINDFNEYPVKPTPKPTTYNYYIEDGEIKKRLDPYLHMKFKQLKDIQNYRSNLDVQKYYLDRDESRVANDKVSNKVLADKRRTDDFLFRQANKPNPLKYTLDEVLHRAANERTKNNDVPTHNELLMGARKALNNSRTFQATKDSWYNNTVLHPLLTPEMSYTPTPMEIIMQSQYQAYNH
jgi:hypothetical protein